MRPNTNCGSKYLAKVGTRSHSAMIKQLFEKEKSRNTSKNQILARCRLMILETPNKRGNTERNVNVPKQWATRAEIVGIKRHLKKKLLFEMKLDKSSCEISSTVEKTNKCTCPMRSRISLANEFQSRHSLEFDFIIVNLIRNRQLNYFSFQ